MLGPTNIMCNMVIAALVLMVLLVLPSSSDPRKKDMNGKTLAQGALEHLLAKTTKSENQEHHGDRTSGKAPGLLNTNILTGGVGVSGIGGYPHGYFPGASGYYVGGSGGGGGSGGPYGGNFGGGGYHHWPDYGSHYYPPWKSPFCHQCYHQCFIPHHRTEPGESDDGHLPNVPYKVKESVEVLERFSRANNDGSQEHK